MPRPIGRETDCARVLSAVCVPSPMRALTILALIKLLPPVTGTDWFIPSLPPPQLCMRGVPSFWVGNISARR